MSAAKPLSFWRLVLSSIRYYARRNVTVALAAAAATAVLTGALLVGDSVRGSLRALTLDRLGAIDEALVADRFFRAELAEELGASEAFPKAYQDAMPAILFPNATVEIDRDGKAQRTANVLLVGITAGFWDLDTSGLQLPRTPGEDEIVINQSLADQWAGEVGEDLILRLPKPSAIPSDSAYGRKSDNTINVPGLKITQILPSRGLGRFSLRPSQAQPLVAFVHLETLQDVLDQPGRANAILVSGRDSQSAADAASSEALQAALRPTLEDLGFSIERVRMRFGEADQQRVIFDYYSFESDRMLISPEARPAVEQAFGSVGGQAVFTYFVNTMVKSGTDVGIPYSMVTAVDPSDAFPLHELAGLPGPKIRPGEIVLTSWAAEDQNAAVDDSIELSYFLPETTHGKAAEAQRSFRVAGVAQLTRPDLPWDGDTPATFVDAPTIANDPDFTPTVEGITDKDSIGDLDVPFPFDIGRLRPDRDDPYWKDYRTTPKAYISLADGERFWGSRFGSATSFRIPHREGVTIEQLGEAFLAALREQGEHLGLEFQPVKRKGLEAASGTTPFDGLFLGLSLFIIAAALLLVSLLFRLNVEQRLSELGLLLALGLGRKRASRAFLAEGALVAFGGALLGVACGVAYAWAMLVGLRTVWVGAITTPFLELHWTPQSLLLGLVSGVIISSLTILLGVRSAANNSVRGLLAGHLTNPGPAGGSAGRWRLLAGVLLLTAIGLGVAGAGLSGEAQAGSFVGSGAIVLTAMLLWTWTRLRFSGSSLRRLSLVRLAIRNARRNPSRSTTSIGLMAVASFLIVSMSAFRLDPSREGAGGFELMALSSQPIFGDLNDPQTRNDLLLGQGRVLEDGQVLSFRVKPGDDASCRNLYQSTAPEVLGVTDATIAYFDRAPSGFVFAAQDADTPMEVKNPWRLLGSESANSDSPIPVILDKNTAAYSLHLMGGVGQEFEAEYEGFGVLKFRVVGLLSNSVLQGRLLISESEFKRRFPDVAGYRFFLIHSPQPQEAVVSVLEDALSDQGFDTQSTFRVLQGLLAVQNTYLSTFQALGSLGLLLGTFGLAAVQLRSVFERRGELALMRAEGFRRRRVAWMVMLENAALLATGLLLGVASAGVAIAPHVIATGARIPWIYLACVLLVVFLVGMTSGITSVRATLRAPVIAALRGD